MQEHSETQELYHEIFGSVLDRTDLTPYLLRNCYDYKSSLERATLMMGNRGFQVVNGVLGPGEMERACGYVSKAIDFMTRWLFPMVEDQMKHLLELPSLATESRTRYGNAMESIHLLQTLLVESPLASLVAEDPRNLFLLVSAKKYPHLFEGHPSVTQVPSRWRFAACAVLKMCHLIKSIEEDSQDIYDYACLGMFFETHAISLSGLYQFPWTEPTIFPTDENARRAFVKVASFFRKLYASISVNEDGGLVFNSGDGVQVDLVEVKARLKSPESMFAKLGKDASGEVYNLRDILAVTFLLKRRDDSLTLFHALQKQGVILQENTVSTSITQTLYDTPEDMANAIRILMCNLARREGYEANPSDEEVLENATSFLNALTANERNNPHSSGLHRKFQCKINYSVPVPLRRDTYRVLMPLEEAPQEELITRQHTLPVELRISDIHSWQVSELSGDAHHDAYKCRQLLVLLNRLFTPLFNFPKEAIAALRADQNRLFK